MSETHRETGTFPDTYSYFERDDDTCFFGATARATSSPASTICAPTMTNVFTATAKNHAQIAKGKATMPKRTTTPATLVTKCICESPNRFELGIACGGCFELGHHSKETCDNCKDAPPEFCGQCKARGTVYKLSDIEGYACGSCGASDAEE